MLRRDENLKKPCNIHDRKMCYSDGNSYSICQFRLAKCLNSSLVLAINPDSC